MCFNIDKSAENSLLSPELYAVHWYWATARACELICDRRRRHLLIRKSLSNADEVAIVEFGGAFHTGNG